MTNRVDVVMVGVGPVGLPCSELEGDQWLRPLANDMESAKPSVPG